MELIKKEFQQITTTATTTCDEGVEGPCYKVIVDESINYNMKILLKARDIDFGFFDVINLYGYYGWDGGTGLGVENLLE